MSLQTRTVFISIESVSPNIVMLQCCVHSNKVHYSVTLLGLQINRKPFSFPVWALSFRQRRKYTVTSNTNDIARWEMEILNSETN